eukprot:2791265-Rhodomonas_salina.1
MRCSVSAIKAAAAAKKHAPGVQRTSVPVIANLKQDRVDATCEAIPVKLGRRHRCGRASAGNTGTACVSAGHSAFRARRDNLLGKRFELLTEAAWAQRRLCQRQTPHSRCVSGQGKDLPIATVLRVRERPAQS